MQIFIKLISNRIDLNKNCLIPVVGETGSGKSYSALSLLLALYEYRNGAIPDVNNLPNHVFFKMLRLMEILDDENLEKKAVRVWDESGIDASHKNHQSLMNKYISYLVQTFRNLQQIIFFTVPNMEFIDATVRKMFHYYLEAKYIDYDANLCVIKPLRMQYNQRMKQIYWHNLEYPSENGYMEYVELMGVPIPPKIYVDKYEEMANDYKKNLISDIRRGVEAIEMKNNNNYDIRSNLPPLQSKLLELQEKGIISTGEQAKILGIYPSAVSTTWGLMKKKGIIRIKNSEKSKDSMNSMKYNSSLINLQEVSDNKVIVSNNGLTHDSK